MENEYEVEPLIGPFYMQEGPHWDAARQTLYFVNIHAKEVHSYKPNTGEHYVATVGKFCKKNLKYLVLNSKRKN